LIIAVNYSGHVPGLVPARGGPKALHEAQKKTWMPGVTGPGAQHEVDRQFGKSASDNGFEALVAPRPAFSFARANGFRSAIPPSDQMTRDYSGDGRD